MTPSLRCPLGIELFEDRFLPSASYLLSNFAPVELDPSGLAGRYSESTAPVNDEHVILLSNSSISPGRDPSEPTPKPAMTPESLFPGRSGFDFDPGLGGSPLNDTFLANAAPAPGPGYVPPPHDMAYPNSPFANTPGVDFTMFDSAARADAIARMSLPTVTGQSIFLQANVAESVDARPAAGTDPPGRMVTPPIAGSILVAGSRPGDIAVASGLSFSPPEGVELSPETIASRPTESDNLPNPDVVLPQPLTPDVVATFAVTTGWIVPALPGGVLVAGVFGLDSAPLEHGAGQLLDHLSDLAIDLPEGSEGSRVGTWLAAAAALTVGAGYTVWAARGYNAPGRRQIAFGSVAGWREGQDDSRTR